MKRETIAIHVGYDGDPTTKAVAVPIYQTIAFEFDSAEHGAALFNLDVQGNIYTRIGNPTNTVLEKRVAALEGGVEALSVSSGMAAIHYALINIAEMGNNIVSLPQLYGATYTLLAHILPKQGIAGRFAESDHPDAVEKLIDENTRAVFCESVGNPAGNVADIEGLARVAHKHGGNRHFIKADRVRRGRGGSLHDEIYGWPRHNARRDDCRQRKIPVARPS